MLRKGDLGRRIAVAAIGVPLALAVLLVGGWLLSLFVAVLAAMAAREMNALALAGGVRGFPWISIPGTFLLVALAGFSRSFADWAPWALGWLLFLFFLCSVAAVRFRTPDERPLVSASLTLASVLYWGVGFSFAVFLRHLPEVALRDGGFLEDQGPVLLAFPLAVTWIADSVAFFFGTAYGRRKMAPRVSPGKTVEGGVAGLAAAILVGVGVGGLLLPLRPDPLLSALLGGVMGLLMGFTVQLGDLIESLYKREAGVKDSGDLLPGHGGILDRFDALIFTLPLAYGLVRLVELIP